MTMKLKDILYKARNAVTPNTWAALSLYIDDKEGKERKYSFAPLGAQARARAWLTAGIPQRYIRYISELTGISEKEILEANYEIVKSKKGN